MPSRSRHASVWSMPPVNLGYCSLLPWSCAPVQLLPCAKDSRPPSSTRSGISPLRQTISRTRSSSVCSHVISRRCARTSSPSMSSVVGVSYVPFIVEFGPARPRVLRVSATPRREYTETCTMRGRASAVSDATPLFMRRGCVRYDAYLGSHCILVVYGNDARIQREVVIPRSVAPRTLGSERLVVRVCRVVRAAVHLALHQQLPHLTPAPSTTHPLPRLVPCWEARTATQRQHIAAVRYGSPADPAQSSTTAPQEHIHTVRPAPQTIPPPTEALGRLEPHSSPQSCQKSGATASTFAASSQDRRSAAAVRCDISTQQSIESITVPVPRDTFPTLYTM